MHRRDDEKDGGTGLPGLSPAVSGPPSGHAVIPFPRRAKAAASAGPATSNSSSADELDAPFIPLSDAIAAVVLKLRGGFPRISVTGPSREDENQGWS